MSQNGNSSTQLSFASYRLPIALIGEIHQYLSQQPAAQTRNLLNAIDASLLADEKAQKAESQDKEKVITPFKHRNEETGAADHMEKMEKL